jgi:hypothetical protein
VNVLERSLRCGLALSCSNRASRVFESFASICERTPLSKSRNGSDIHDSLIPRVERLNRGATHRDAVELVDELVDCASSSSTAVRCSLINGNQLT